MSNLITTDPKLITSFLHRFPRGKTQHKNTLFYNQFYYKVCYKIENAYNLVSATTYYVNPPAFVKKSSIMPENVAQQTLLNSLRDAGKCRTIAHDRYAFSLFVNDLSIIDSLAEIGLTPYTDRIRDHLRPRVIVTTAPKGKIRLINSPHRYRCFLNTSRPVDISTINFLSELDPKIGKASSATVGRGKYSKNLNHRYLPANAYIDLHDAEAVTYITLAGAPVSKVFEIITS